MPYILQRLEYSDDGPRIGIIDTDSSYNHEIALNLGYEIPPFGIWGDKRYCRCGHKIVKRPATEADFDPILAVNLNYLCPQCAQLDQLNRCIMYGVWRDNEKGIACHQCYKWSSECINGYCLYIAMLTPSQSELKVGITRLGRKNQRAAEAGYSLMGIIMPEGRNSLSLPQAEFLEKKIISGQTITFEDQVLKINERFTRDLGMVGSEPTKKLTFDALLSEPSDEGKRKFTAILDRVAEIANTRCSAYESDPTATSLTPLRTAEIIEDRGVQIERRKLEGFNYQSLTGLTSRTFKGRRYRRIPLKNKIIGVKGPCIVLDTEESPVVFRMNRYSVAGREIFNPIATIDNKEDDREVKLTWF
jgi:hypothetical protein